MRPGLVISTVASIMLAILVSVAANGHAAGAPHAPAGVNHRAIAAATATDPMAQVQDGVAAVIAVFRDPAMPLRQRRAKLSALADRYFDFAAMARSVMGYHWRSLTPAQRAQFVPLFAAFIKDAYLTKMRDYVVKKVQSELPAVRIDYTHESFDGADYATVYSNIHLPEQKDPIAVNYLMHRVSGEWRIYDLTIAAIDVIGNYRSQFNHALNDEGYDKMIAILRAKQQTLRRELANPETPRPAA